MKLKGYFIVLTFLGFVISPGSSAVTVLKTKGQQVLIHLEGLKTKEGAYFTAINLENRKKGIVQIKKVAHTKAIGVLKYGSVAKEWSLKPLTKKQALAIQMKAKIRAERLALLQELKRQELARKRQAQRQLAQKKKDIHRKLNSYDGGVILEDLPEDNSSQSEDILSYSEEDKINFTEKDSAMEKAQKYYGRQDLPNRKRHFAIGLSPLVSWDWLYVTPPGKKPSYLMSGLGFGGSLLVDVSLNSFIRGEGFIGGKKFSVSTGEKQCGVDGGCHVTTWYLMLGGNLKLDLIQLGRHKLWLAGGGTLLQPLAYSNNILNEKSFAPFHGTAGGGLGLDLTFGNFIIPVSLRGDVYIPPTKTTMTGSLRGQIGIAYKF